MNRGLEEFWADFRAGLAQWIGSAPSATVLYSGGLDSSLVAWAAKDLATCRLLVVGVIGSADIAAAESGAANLGLPLQVQQSSADETLAARAELAAWVDGPPRALVPVRLGFALAVRAALDPVVLCGQGADELALGYRHFVGLSENELVERAERDWNSLTLVEWPRAQGFAHSVGKRLGSPFLMAPFAQNVRDLGVGAHRPTVEPKPWLRTLAAHAGLPEPLVHRRKRALQYGTGFDRVLRQSERPTVLLASRPRP